MFDPKSLLRPHLRNLVPYSSARDEYSGREGVFLDANENSLGSAIDTAYQRYPDPYQRELKAKIAEIKGVEADHIFLGNGSDEPIDLLYRAFCEPDQDNVIITPPTYGMYEVSAGIHNVEVLKVNLTVDFHLKADEILATANSCTKIIWLCSPNNPTGNLIDKADIEKIIKSFDGIVVVDEAYIDFADQPSMTGVLDRYPNLVVLHTFSKAWGMAGLRLGAAFASREIVAILNLIKAPYNLSQATQLIALEAMNNESQVKQMVAVIIRLRRELAEQLSSLSQVEHIYPSDANFLLVRFREAQKVFDYLIAQKIIVRNRRKVVLCDEGLRITVGTREENLRLIDTLKNMPS
ncbi:MAG: histidinol-phosphate transaminase [Cyclobacteriaceae bacterium]